MELQVEDISTVIEEIFDVRAKCYDIGIVLKLSMGTLDSIMKQYSNPSDQLREVVKAWLRTATQRTWQTLAEALKSRMVGEQRLASDIETKYCQATPEQASGQRMPRDTEIQALQQQVKTKNQKEKRLEDSQKSILGSITELTAQMKTTMCEQVERLEGENEKLTQKLQTMERAAPQPQPNPPLKKLMWWDCPEAPETMSRGSVATDGTIVYLNSGGSTKVHQYHSDSQQWSQLPDLPYKYSTVVMAGSKLTSVGGYLGQGETTNSLLSLTARKLFGKKWSPHYPPMINKRCNTAAICNGRSLIIAGGDDGKNYLATVEVMNMDARQWFIASSLPHLFSLATVSICSERLFVLGGYDLQIGHVENSVFACSIPELLHSCQAHSAAVKPSKNTIWQCVAEAPYYGSSCATLCGRLVVVGGRDENGQDTTFISTYDENTDSFLTMDTMTTPRYRALVVSVKENTMMVIGGCGLATVVRVDIL